MPSPVTRNMDLAPIQDPVRRSCDDADEANHGCDYDPDDSPTGHRAGREECQYADAHYALLRSIWFLSCGHASEPSNSSGGYSMKRHDKK